MMTKMHTLVGLFLILGLCSVGYLSLGLGTPWERGRELKINAVFDDASGIRLGNRVEVAGVPVGRVAKVGLGEDGSTAVVQLALKPLLEIHDDTIASIRTAGLIGETYVSLQPGGSGVILKEGETLYETESATNLGELISKVAFGSIDSDDSDESE